LRGRQNPQAAAFKILQAAVLFMLLSALPISAYAKAKKESISAFGSESFTLDNGLQVVIIPNHRAPVVHHMLWYKVGAADEKAGETGLAHFVEHMMFKGTAKFPEMPKTVQNLGGQQNAFTGKDFTAYYQTVAKKYLETMMEMEADRMNNLLFDDNDVLSERHVVLEERRQSTENDPHSYFYEQLQAALFVNHPYSAPVVGWFNEVDVLDRTHVKNFYETWYAPNNAILIVSGDITAAELKPLAEKIYGPIPRKEVPARNWTKVPPLLGLPQLTMHSPDIRQPSLTRLYRAPSYNQSPRESMALQVLEDILGGGPTARLYKTLVVDQHMATDADISYQATSYSDSMITFGFTPATNISLEEVEWAFNDLLREVIKTGVTENEMKSAKQRMKDSIVHIREDLRDPATMFGQSLTTGVPREDLENWPVLVDAVTAEEVRHAAEKYLNPDDFHKMPYVTGYLLPQDEKLDEIIEGEPQRGTPQHE
jgi:zinc protease